MYTLALERVSVGKWSFDLHALADFERTVGELCDGITEAVTNERLVELCPFFGKLWPSGRLLAQRLERMGRGGLAGRTVLEVGCGLGLPSFVAARLGADALATDFHPDAGAFFARNVAANPGPAPRYARMDWRNAEDLGSFDLVVGSDILYDAEQPRHLAQFLGTHLRAGGSVIVTDPGRAYLQKFAALMDLAGFETELDVVDDVFVLTSHDRRQDVADDIAFEYV